MKISSVITFKLIPAYLLIIAVFLAFQSATAQKSDDNVSTTLNKQFQELKNSSESYNEYKVIKTYKLNEFWSTVNDSLNTYRNKINVSEARINKLEQELDAVKEQLSNTQADLETAITEKDSFSIFGLNIHKNLYNIILWGIIIGLLVLSGFSFIAFKESNRVTRRTKKDHDDLHKEFEDYRRKAQEKKVKIMRELQTERNKVDELMQKQFNKEHSNS